MTDLRKNEVFTCEITGYTAQGAGVAHIHDRAVFVPETVAGETWEVKLVRVTASAVYGKGINLLSPAPARYSRPGRKMRRLRGTAFII